MFRGFGQRLQREVAWAANKRLAASAKVRVCAPQQSRGVRRGGGLVPALPLPSCAAGLNRK